VQEQQALIILQKIMLRLIIQATLIKIAHLIKSPQRLAIMLQLLLEADLAVVHQEVADLLAVEEQKQVVAINHHKNSSLKSSNIF
jgi:hypothetical protein